MRSCGRLAELLTALDAEEPFGPDLSAHVGTCAECNSTLSCYRRIERDLTAAVGRMITDAMPADTVHAARLGVFGDRVSVLPKLIFSGVSAATLLLFAAIGIAATSAGVVGALTRPRTSGPNPNVVQGEFEACYVQEAQAFEVAASRNVTVTVERCLADASEDLDVADYGIVIALNRVAVTTSACLRTQGWKVQPVLESKERFLVPPAMPPADGDQERYLRDVQSCTAEPR